MTSDDPDENTVALNHAPRAIDGPCREFRQFRVFPAGRDAFVIGNPIGFPGRTFCEIIWANWCLAVAALPMLVQSGKFGFEILSFLKSSAQAILGRREPQHRHVGKMEQRRGGRRSGRYRIRTRQPVGNPAWWDPSALSRLWILQALPQRLWLPKARGQNKSLETLKKGGPVSQFLRDMFFSDVFLHKLM
jgi:hypothetical protein